MFYNAALSPETSSFPYLKMFEDMRMFEAHPQHLQISVNYTSHKHQPG